MKSTRHLSSAILPLLASLLGILGLFAGSVPAHCDTLDGPVAVEVRAALARGDVTPVLKWVTAADEKEVRDVFARVVKASAQGPEAKEVAERYFLETVVRLHRQSEGAPYTGLKPAGTMARPVAMADKAIETGTGEDLAGRIGKHATAAVLEKYQALMEARKHKDESVEAGRAYVAAYVVFLHFVEGLHAQLHGEAGHAGEVKAPPCMQHAK
ncbi:MAG: hypothetical protein KA419_01135 [Acidobacteria bacterium]|nr:hypothetical protein [Acidobacteriota bacterium]